MLNKSIFFAISLALAGCGHVSRYTDTTPTQVRSSFVDNGLWTTDTQMSVKNTRSEYEACMDRYRGYAGAQAECADRMGLDRPVGSRYGAWYPYTPYPYAPGYGRPYAPGYGYGAVQPYVTPRSMVYGW